MIFFLYKKKILIEWSLNLGHSRTFTTWSQAWILSENWINYKPRYPLCLLHLVFTHVYLFIYFIIRPQSQYNILMINLKLVWCASCRSISSHIILIHIQLKKGIHHDQTEKYIQPTVLSHEHCWQTSNIYVTVQITH